MFNIGDKVKLKRAALTITTKVYGNDNSFNTGTVVEKTADSDNTIYLVKFPEGFKGHDGNGRSKEVYEHLNVLWFTEDVIELAKGE